ncbi:hypothetical protein OGAPHI_003408 [Ogataea philodendri]|uniref:RRM domain-containing protein n=1 Tax=Ogataea philodendri TaxID=1378263 RepID=A0A9P8P7F7_9ASCO|nr:uncharacterized protein OGAPHI_003408 [Ogataea philodendri]KAH3666958.1 hypothetical protein OGAPHI_003408 [Ogataea philodendri]
MSLGSDQPTSPGGALSSPIVYYQDVSTAQYVVNVFNLPARLSKSDLDLLLQTVAVNTASIGAIQIYNSPNNQDAWASISAFSYSTAAGLANKLDGYEFDGSILQCQLINSYQPQSSAFYSDPVDQGVQPYFVPTPLATPMPAPIPMPSMPPYYPYYSYGMPIQRARSVSFPYADPQPAAAAPPHSFQPHANRPQRRQPNRPQQRVELGNNYSSILNPDFDKDESDQDSDSSVDDNEKPTDQLVQFSASKYVSPTRLFIGNIPFQSNYLSVLNYLNANASLVSHLYLKTQPNGGSKGFAIALTSSLDDSVEVIRKFNGASFEGRDLIVRFDKLPKLILKSHNIKKRKSLEKKQADEKENHNDQSEPDQVAEEKQVAQELVLTIKNTKPLLE